MKSVVYATPIENAEVLCNNIEGSQQLSIMSEVLKKEPNITKRIIFADNTR